jgi:hypothetical protein
MGEETRRNIEQTSVAPSTCQADALPIELQPHPDSVNGRKSVAPSLAKLDSYNNHRPIQRVPAAVLSQPPVPAAVAIFFPGPGPQGFAPQALRAGRGAIIIFTSRICRKGGCQ